MNEQQKSQCSQCGAVEVINVSRDEFYKGVLIQNLPATHCQNCGEDLYDLATVQLMERVAAEPEVFAKMIKMPVVRVA